MSNCKNIGLDYRLKYIEKSLFQPVFDKGLQDRQKGNTTLTIKKQQYILVCLQKTKAPMEGNGEKNKLCNT